MTTAVSPSPASTVSGPQAAGGTVALFIAEALILPTGLILSAFLARHLGVTGYGLYTLAASFIAWIEWSLAALFARAGIKFVSEASDWRPVGSTLMRLHLAVSLAAMLLLMLLAGPIAALLGEPTLASALRLFALDIPLFCMAAAHRVILAGTGQYVARAQATSLRWLSRLALVALLVGLGLSLEGAILGSIGASAVELAVARRFARPALFRRSEFPARQLLGYAAPLFLSALALSLFDRLDLLMLKALDGTATQAGYYGAAMNLAFVPAVAALAFSPVLLSLLSRVWREGERSRARAIGQDALRAMLWLLPPLSLGAGASSELVTLVFGGPFLPAAPLFTWLLLAGAALAVLSIATTILTAAGKPGWTFGLVGPMVALSGVGYALVIPRYGPLGAAMTTAAFAVLGATASLIAVWRLLSVRPPFMTLLRCVPVCAAAYTLAAACPTPGFWVFLKLTLLAPVSLLPMALLGEFTASDVALFRSLWSAPKTAPSCGDASPVRESGPSKTTVALK
jgi:O-antigen/teichoic acid export membrane protein